jgi:hypothetical protein
MVNTNRTFLNHQFVSFFYKTSPVLVIPLSFYIYRFFNRTPKVRYFFLSVLFFVTLVLSGTRANIFSAILLIGLLVVNKFYKSRFWRPIAIFTLIIIGMATVIMVIVLFQDNDLSIMTKSHHISSIMALFKEYPLILLLGHGPGSLYYSTGFDQFIYFSEVSYLEIIRIFGIIFGSLIIFVFVFPLIIAYRYRTSINEYFPFNISYLAYLFIGGTNPLLIGSTGFLVLATVYSFVLRRGV